MTDLDEHYGWVVHRVLHDGRVVAIAPLMFGWRLTVSIDPATGYDDGW